jgi:hypothetical protein
MGPPQRDLLIPAALLTRRHQPQLGELAGHVVGGDIIARGAWLAAPQQVVGQEIDVRLETLLQQPVPLWLAGGNGQHRSQ